MTLTILEPLSSSEYFEFSFAQDSILPALSCLFVNITNESTHLDLRVIIAPSPREYPTLKAVWRTR